MGRAITVELSEGAYTALERRAQAEAQSPAKLAAEALEQCFGLSEGERPVSEPDGEAARRRFEGRFGSVDLGHATGVDNESIDADLARAYAGDHKDG